MFTTPLALPFHHHQIWLARPRSSLIGERAMMNGTDSAYFPCAPPFSPPALPPKKFSVSESPDNDPTLRFAGVTTQNCHHLHDISKRTSDPELLCCAQSTQCSGPPHSILCPAARSAALVLYIRCLRVVCLLWSTLNLSLFFVLLQ